MTFLNKFPQIGHVSLYPSGTPHDLYKQIPTNRSCVTVSLRNTRMTFLSKFPQIGHVSLYPSVAPHDLSAQILPNRSCVTYFPASCGSDVLCSPDTHSNAASRHPLQPWHTLRRLQLSHTHSHTLIYHTPIIENIFLCMLKSIL